MFSKYLCQVQVVKNKLHLAQDFVCVFTSKATNRVTTRTLSSLFYAIKLRMMVVKW